MLTPRCALFDLDGTLVDSLGVMTESFNHLFGELCGRPISREEVVASLGPPLVKICERYVGPELAEQYALEYVAYYNSVNARLARVYSGVREVLERLQQNGIQMAIVSSKKRATAEETLRRFDLEQYMQTIITEDDVAVLKPDPEAILMAIDRLQARPTESVMVGDSPGDILAAKAAGVLSAGACWGFSGDEVLRQYSPDYLLRSPRDLIQVFFPSASDESGPSRAAT